MSESLPFPRVSQLSPQLANQIAAGEVIERPSSVVKELLENSLDAAATRIKVEISQSGAELIKVQDNGHGLHPDDMELALQRHATAKLHKQSDLATISSLGFRGEALPSISSVAEFSMTSRIADMDRGVRISFDPRTGLSKIEPAAHPVGTTVEVSRLFANTPARRKFLRTERTEFLHIQAMMKRLALSRFNFFLRLEHNGKHIFSCHDASVERQQRVAEIMGQAFVNQASVVDHRSGNMHLWGWLGDGELARCSTDKQYLYLNGRMIQDKRLNHAIRVACEGRISEGRFPAYVLHLQMDYSDADVNVHPAKNEVRFRQTRDVYDFVCAALARSLQSEPGLISDGDNSVRFTAEHKQINEVSESVSGASSHPSGGQQTYGFSYARAPARAASPEKSSSALGTFLVQVSDKLVLLTRDTEIVMLDLELARRHIAEYKISRLDDSEPLTARPLLVPVSFELNQSQHSVLQDLEELLNAYSLEIELTGPASCRLRVLPHFLSNADIQALLSDILSIKTAKLPALKLKKTLEEILLAHLSDIPHVVNKAEQIYALIRQLQESGLPLENKNHRPVWTSLVDEDLLKLLESNGN